MDEFDNNVIHFCGIGGIGLSGMAQILKSKGLNVQGSDSYKNENTKRLEKLGIPVFTPQVRENLKGVSIFLHSSAISESNPEFQEAKEKNLKILKRHEMLNEITKLYFTVSVSGTHGKTTTTGIISSMFEAAEKNPTILIGGVLEKFKNNAVITDSQYLILEADESDETFIKINSNISVITNVDVEHLDYYKSYENIIEAFQKYEANVPETGCLVYCNDHPISKKIGTNSKKTKLSYGIDELSDVQAKNIKYFENITYFDILYKGELLIENANIRHRGAHNVLNSLASVSVSLFMNFSIESMRRGLENFEGVENRSEYIGSVAGVSIYRDYAHHPVEIHATISGFKCAFKDRQIFCIHEPYRFNRVHDLWDLYIDCFVDLDYLFLKKVAPFLDETQIGEANSKSLALKIQKTHPNIKCRYFEDYKEIMEDFSNVRKNDLILLLGAKDIQNDAFEFAKILKKQLTIDFPDIYPTSRHIKNVGAGSTFVVPTVNHAQSIPLAVAKGASRIVLHDEYYQEEHQLLCKKNNVEYIFVQNPAKSLAHYSSEALGHPSRALKIIGITGTNGKSTTTYMIEHLLRNSGKKVALVGGVENKICGISLGKSDLTTPQSDYLHVFFNESLKRNVEYVVMEVSSQAIDLHRVEGIEFACIGFTNLTRDHLDFHKTMENYFESKMKCFQQLKQDGFCVVNTDCDWGKKAILSHIKKDQKALNLNSDIIDEFLIQESKDLNSSLYGGFNAYNMMMAKLICQEFGISVSNELLKRFSGAPGRLQKHLLKNQALAIVDYAHSPDAVENVLKTVRNDTTNLIVILSAAGERDKGKRPLMGTIAEKYADTIILTICNPRTENPSEIVNDIKNGISNQSKIIIEFERGKAINKAVKLSSKGTIITILGKGHEDYITIKNENHRFNDFEEISKY